METYPALMMSAVRGAEICKLELVDDGVGGAGGYVEVLKYAAIERLRLRGG